jgi:hypothetical protein
MAEPTYAAQLLLVGIDEHLRRAIGDLTLEQIRDAHGGRASSIGLTSGTSSAQRTISSTSSSSASSPSG